MQAVGVALLIGLAGCGVKNDGVLRVRKARPIVVVLSQKKNSNTCEAKFGKRAQHAFNGDEVVWEFINNCDADKNVTLAVKNGSNNPFTVAAPWTVAASTNGNPAELSLTLKDATGAPPGTYGFDIVVDGTSYDPKLEIDP
jgi:hypothetical protein